MAGRVRKPTLYIQIEGNNIIPKHKAEGKGRVPFTLQYISYVSAVYKYGMYREILKNDPPLAKEPNPYDRKEEYIPYHIEALNHSYMDMDKLLKWFSLEKVHKQIPFIKEFLFDLRVKYDKEWGNLHQNTCWLCIVKEKYPCFDCAPPPSPHTITECKSKKFVHWAAYKFDVANYLPPPPTM